MKIDTFQRLYDSTYEDVVLGPALVVDSEHQRLLPCGVGLQPRELKHLVEVWVKGVVNDSGFVRLPIRFSIREQVDDHEGVAGVRVDLSRREIETFLEMNDERPPFEIVINGKLERGVGAYFERFGHHDLRDCGGVFRRLGNPALVGGRFREGKERTRHTVILPGALLSIFIARDGSLVVVRGGDIGARSQHFFLLLDFVQRGALLGLRVEILVQSRHLDAPSSPSHLGGVLRTPVAAAQRT